MGKPIHIQDTYSPETNIREYAEGMDVEIIMDIEEQRIVVKALNEAGHN